MDKESGTLTVFFDEPFWVGVFERKSVNREQRRAQKERQFHLKQQKRKEKKSRNQKFSSQNPCQIPPPIVR